MNNRYVYLISGLRALLLATLLFLPLSAIAHGPMMGGGMMGLDDDADYGMTQGPCPGFGMGYGRGMGMMGGMGYGHGPGMMGGMGYGMGYGLQQLELTDAQHEKIGQIQQRMRKQQYERMGAMMEAREAMQLEMLKDQPDPEAVARAHEKASAIRREMLKSHIEARNEMRGVLSEEQRERMRGMGGMMW